MGMMAALNAAVTGLRATQAGIDVVSQNVANSGSVGYSRRTISNVQVSAGDRTTGVRTGEIQRVLDKVALRQLRLETAGAAYTDLRASYAASLDQLFGTPGQTGSLDGALNTFTETVQRLASNPGDYSARVGVVDSAGQLADRLGSIGEGVQALRGEAERRIDAAVTRSNEILDSLGKLNDQIVGAQARGSSAALLDERDRLLNELSQFMDIQINEAPNGSLRIATGGGQTLLEGPRALRLEFDANGSPQPESLWSADPAQRGVGTITAVSPTGSRIDLIANGSIRSGEIAGLLEMRDVTLVEAQRQLDEVAAGLATATMERRTAGVANGTGFNVAMANVGAGDVLDIAVVNGGVRRDVTVVLANGADPALPTPNPADPNRPVVRVDVGAGLGPPPNYATIATALSGNATLTGLNLSFTGTATGVAIASTGTLSGASFAEIGSNDNPAGGFPPIFADGGATGDTRFGGTHPGGTALTGLAQRLTVNGTVRAQPATLIGYGAASGDATRPTEIAAALTKTTRTFSREAGIGGSGAPYVSTLADYTRRVIEDQGANSENASRLNEGQKVALSSIEGRFAESAAVNVDQEMATLVQLQTAYGANARVMTAVRDMLDLLMRV